MKTITLWQPWATLVVIGAKKIETRSFNINYRGPLVIHSSGKFPTFAKVLVYSNPVFRKALMDPNGHLIDLPLGSIVGTCILGGCWIIKPGPVCIPMQEYIFGNYSPGRFMWMLEDAKQITPIPAKGHQGLWNWDGNMNAMEFIDGKK